MANYPIPDNSNAPTKHFIAVIREAVGGDQEKALAVITAVYGAGWEIVSKRIVDEILKSGGLTPEKIQELNNASN